MNIKNLIYTLLLLCSFTLFAEETEWVNTEATIKNIEIKGTKRAKEFATVSYVTKDGETLEGQIELLRIPFLGSFKNVGDTVDVHYNKQNPHSVESVGEGYINKYGMYVLIGLGVIFSLKQFTGNKR